MAKKQINKYDEAYNNIGSVYVASEGKDLIASDYYEKSMDILLDATEKAKAFDILSKYIHIETYDGDSMAGESDSEDLILDDSMMKEEEFEFVKRKLNEI